MNPMPQLEPMLKQLRLSGILNSLEPRNRQAVEDKLAYTEFLALLIQDEIARREQRKLAMRMRRAGFQSQKTFESFDFSFNPSINRAQALDLATCRFMRRRPTSSSRDPAARARATWRRPWDTAPSGLLVAQHLATSLMGVLSPNVVSKKIL